MASSSAIEWTDATWNPVTGCTKISPGCKFCYAERLTRRFGLHRGSHWWVLEPDAEDARDRDRTAMGFVVNLIAPEGTRGSGGLLGTGVLHLPDERHSNISAPQRDMEVAVIPDGVRLVPNVINDRRDGRRHAVPLRLQKSLPEAKFRSKGQVWEAGKQRGNAKDCDTAVKAECQPRSPMSSEWPCHR